MTPVAVPRRGGRPRVAPRKQIHIRLTAEERIGLERVARENRQSLTAFIREAVVEAVADCTDERVLQA